MSILLSYSMPPRQRPARRQIRTAPRTPSPEHHPDSPVHQEVGDVDMHLHEILRFRKPEDREHLQPLLAKDFEQTRRFSYEALQVLGFLDRAHQLTDPLFTRLFRIHEPIIEELAYEFFSTITFIESRGYEDDRAVTFRMRGHEQHLSVAQFATHMDLYTEAEVETAMFTEGLTDYPAGVTDESIWSQLGEGEFIVGTAFPKASRLRDPLHRILHKAIAHTICCRRDSTGSVTRQDLFYLYCMTQGRTCQLAVRLLRLLSDIRHGKRNQPIYGAPYVTRLARGMGLYFDEEAADFTTIARGPTIDLETLTHMGMVRKDGPRYVVLDGRGQPWVAPGEEQDQEQQDQEQGGDRAQRTPSPVRRPVDHARDTATTSQPLIQYSRRIPSAIAERFRRLEQRMDEGLAGIARIQRLEIARAEAFRTYMISLIAPQGSAPPPPMHPDLAAFLDQPGPSRTHDSPER